MDASAKKMLRFIQTSPICKNGDCLLIDFYDAYCQYANCSTQEAMSCIRYLADVGYIKFGHDQYGNENCFELEHRARHRTYFTLKEQWMFIRNSIIIPVFVSAITAILTTDVWPLAKSHAGSLFLKVLESIQKWMR